MNEETQDRSLNESIDMIMRNQMLNLFVSMPAKIESYDNATQIASVKPLNVTVKQDDDGNEVVEELPVISNVPIFLPQSEDFFISFPIKKGDLCFLVFADRSLDSYLESDGSQPKDSKDNRAHSLNDCYAFVGFGTKRKVINNTSDTDLVIAKKDGTAEFKLTNSNEITFKGNAARFGEHDASLAVALAKKTNDRISAIESHINSSIANHTHTTIGIGVPTTTATGNIIPGSDVSSNKMFASS